VKRQTQETQAYLAWAYGWKAREQR